MYPAKLGRGGPDCECEACKAERARNQAPVPLSQLQGRRIAIAAVVAASSLVLIILVILYLAAPAAAIAVK